MIKFAAGGEPVRNFPLLYQFCCMHIYAMQSDQQETEGTFNLWDLSVNPNMSAVTAGATVMLKGLPAPVKVDATKRTAAAKAIAKRARDYGRMSYISRVYGLHGEKKGSDLERKTAPRSRACKNRCKDSCQRCVVCPDCGVLYFLKGQRKHLAEKHPERLAKQIQEELEPPVPPDATPDKNLPKIPSTMKRLEKKVEVGSDEKEVLESDGLDSDDELFCYCQQPDDGEFMLACDDCDMWYHLDCLVEYRGVSITCEEAAQLDYFKCPDCNAPQQCQQEGGESEQEMEDSDKSEDDD